MRDSDPDLPSVPVLTSDLHSWSEILPSGCRVLDTNLFGDVFLIGLSGSVYMLELAVGSISEVAASEAEFRRLCQIDEEGWLLRPLAARCRAVGMTLGPGQCYTFTTLPLFGGEYQVENIWKCAWRGWFGFLGSVYAQTKNLPDGSNVTLAISE